MGKNKTFDYLYQIISKRQVQLAKSQLQFEYIKALVKKYMEE